MLIIRLCCLSCTPSPSLRAHLPPSPPRAPSPLQAGAAAAGARATASLRAEVEALRASADADAARRADEVRAEVAERAQLRQAHDALRADADARARADGAALSEARSRLEVRSAAAAARHCKQPCPLSRLCCDSCVRSAHRFRPPHSHARACTCPLPPPLLPAPARLAPSPNRRRSACCARRRRRATRWRARRALGTCRSPSCTSCSRAHSRRHARGAWRPLRAWGEGHARSRLCAAPRAAAGPAHGHHPTMFARAARRR